MTRADVRPERRRPNAIHLFAKRDIEASPERVHRFLVERVPDCYQELSPGHERYVVVGGGPLREGGVVDCRERAGDQEVHHSYVVRALRPGEHLHLASTPSRSLVHLPNGRTVEGVADTHVYYDLVPLGEGRTRLEMTIVIALPGFFRALLAKASGSRALWAHHQEGELDALVPLVEQWCPGEEPGRRPPPAQTDGVAPGSVRSRCDASSR